MTLRATLSRWPVTRQLWTLVGGVALFDLMLTLIAGLTPGPRIARGQDFMAFYAAGRLAAAGDGPAIYDLATLGALERRLAADAGIQMVSPIAPFLNPPHVALLFVPFAPFLRFDSALIVWTIFSLASLVASGLLLARIVAEASPLRRHRWLAIACALVSPPALLALGHGQNTPLSLLLLTLAVVAWRAGRPVAAGLACAALAYKPHLAATVALCCTISLGRRVLVGLAIGGATTLAATLLALPGALAAYVTTMPDNFRQLFVDRAFRWQRHVTFYGFTRHLFHGNGPGENAPWITALTFALVACAAVALLLACWRLRARVRAGDDIARDRLIVAAVCATPLVAPYFLDYDLLLPLCVGGALVGREMLATRDARGLTTWFVRIAMVTYAWLVANAIAAESIGISLTTPLLVALFALHAWRCVRATNEASDLHLDRRSTCKCEAPPTKVAA